MFHQPRHLFAKTMSAIKIPTLKTSAMALAASLLLWGASVATAQTATAEQTVLAEHRLPPGVLAFFSIPDATDFAGKFHESSFGQMLQDDSLVDFREQFEEKFAEASGELEEEIGLSIGDLLSLMDGEVTIAVMQPPGRSLGGVLMLEFGDNNDTLDTILETVQQKVEDEGVERTLETIEDTDVTVYLNENEQDGPNTFAYFVRDQYLVLSLSSSTDLLEDILVRWDGEHAQTFADDDVYSYMMQKCQPEGADKSQMRWYFSPIGLFRAVATMPQLNQGGMSPAMVLGFLPALGLDKFKAVGGGIGDGRRRV